MSQGKMEESATKNTSDTQTETIQQTPIVENARPAALDDMDEILIRSEICKALNISTDLIQPIPRLSDPKYWQDIFPYHIIQRRGIVPMDANGKFFYVDPNSVNSKFTTTATTLVPFRVIVNLPFYAGSENSIAQTIDVFTNTGFDSNRKISAEKAANVLIFVVGINMMESLDESLNTKVAKKLTEPVNSVCEVHRFGFYWRPIWADQNNNPIDFETVREYYQRIKAKNPVLARNMLKHLENTSTKMIPYREIREVLKQHICTTTMAAIFRAQNPNTPVYLGLFDPDMISASCVFATYTQLITSYQQQHNGQAPTVLTTGYRLPLDDARHDSSPLYHLAVELDMAVRHATARYIKDGVYYPEPNILVLFDADTMTESFMDGASLQQPSHYNDPYEWPVFMGDLIQKRKLDPNKVFIFAATNPIITTMPDRMRYELGAHNKLKVFHGRFNATQQIIRWQPSDLRYLIETSQSHASPATWSSRLVRSLGADWDAKSITAFNNKKARYAVPFKDLRDPLGKILKIFFEQLDPLSRLSHSAGVSAQPEVKQFAQILANYHNTLPLFLPSAQNYSSDAKPEDLIHLLKNTPAKQQETLLRSWSNEHLQLCILYLLGNDVGARYINAGFTATAQLVAIYTSTLNTRFAELTQNFLVSFYNECQQKSQQTYAGDLPFTETQKAILNGHYDPNNPTFTAEELLATGKFHLNGLHIAALVGDYKLVIYALRHVSAAIEADAHVLPLHCAILYLINNGIAETNGNDLPLVTVLVADETRFIKTDLGLTALGLVLTRLENAASVAKQCMLGWDVPEFVTDNIEEMARVASLTERQTPLLAMMNKLSRPNRFTQHRHYTPRSIMECGKHGFSILATGVIENRILISMREQHELTQLEEQTTTTLAEAVRQDDLGTFNNIRNAIKKAGSSLPSDLTDRDGRPLAISAVINTDYPSSWLKSLKELGIPLAVTDPIDGSPILHEAIFSAALRRLNPTTKDRRRYYEGLEEYLHNIASYQTASINKLLAINLLLNEPDIDVNQSDIVGDKPLDIALAVDYPIVVWHLIRAGARFNHLDKQQTQQLMQILGFLYLIGEYKKDAFESKMNAHPDFTPEFKKQWHNIIKEKDTILSGGLTTFKFFSDIANNIKELDKWFKANINKMTLLKINTYIELSFKYYILSYEDVMHFYSLPIRDRYKELLEVHHMNLDTYQCIKKFEHNFVTKVHQHFILSLPRARSTKTNNKKRKNKVGVQKQSKSKQSKSYPTSSPSSRPVSSYTSTLGKIGNTNTPKCFSAKVATDTKQQEIITEVYSKLVAQKDPIFAVNLNIESIQNYIGQLLTETLAAANKTKLNNHSIIPSILPNELQEVDVPNDNHCLFWCAALALLLPRLDDDQAFATMYLRLFGRESIIVKDDNGEKVIKIDAADTIAAVKHILCSFDCQKDTVRQYQDDILSTLICTVFRGRVVNKLSKVIPESDRAAAMADRPVGTTWAQYLDYMRGDAFAGEPEIQGISALAQVNIHVYSSLYTQPREVTFAKSVEIIFLFHANAENENNNDKNHYHFGLTDDLYKRFIANSAASKTSATAKNETPPPVQSALSSSLPLISQVAGEYFFKLNHSHDADALKNKLIKLDIINADKLLEYQPQSMDNPDAAYLLKLTDEEHKKLVAVSQGQSISVENITKFGSPMNAANPVATQSTVPTCTSQQAI